MLNYISYDEMNITSLRHVCLPSASRCFLKTRMELTFPYYVCLSPFEFDI